MSIKRSVWFFLKWVEAFRLKTLPALRSDDVRRAFFSWLGSQTTEAALSQRHPLYVDHLINFQW